MKEERSITGKINPNVHARDVSGLHSCYGSMLRLW